MSLNVTALSIVGSVDFGFMSCPDVVPDLQSMADHVPVALAELEAAAPRKKGSRRTPAAKKAAPAKAPAAKKAAPKKSAVRKPA